MKNVTMLLTVTLDIVMHGLAPRRSLAGWAHTSSTAMPPPVYGDIVRVGIMGELVSWLALRAFLMVYVLATVPIESCSGDAEGKPARSHGILSLC